jgi:regulator of sigma E protease
VQEFFGSVWWLIVSLGVLVTFHEFGHYWVGRRFGIRVLRFSVGFGRPLWKRVGRDGTEWVVAAIPLGGYVKFLDEREDDVPPAQRVEAFNAKPAWQRFLVALAGPAFNLFLCIALLWGMFLIGKDDFQPTIGRSTGIAADAGLREGDRIVSIDGLAMDTWAHAAIALAGSALDRAEVDVEVRGNDGAIRHVPLDLARLGEDMDEARVLQEVGVVPEQLLLPALIGEVRPDTPAAAAGLQQGDRIVSIGASPIDVWNDVPDEIQRQAGEHPLRLGVQRDGQTLSIELRPRRDADGQWRVGIGPQPGTARYDALLKYGPVDAVGAALRETWRLTDSTLDLLGHMLAGNASLKNISGPISIAQYANATAGAGFASFLGFLAILSLSLCIMNLLPIPILDGGHLVYCLVEMAKGSPVSERTMAAGQYVGLALLAGLMGLAFYNDILRLVSS